MQDRRARLLLGMILAVAGGAWLVTTPIGRPAVDAFSFNTAQDGDWPNLMAPGAVLLFAFVPLGVSLMFAAVSRWYQGIPLVAATAAAELLVAILGFEWAGWAGAAAGPPCGFVTAIFIFGFEIMRDRRSTHHESAPPQLFG